MTSDLLTDSNKLSDMRAASGIHHDKESAQNRGVQTIDAATPNRNSLQTVDAIITSTESFTAICIAETEPVTLGGAQASETCRYLRFKNSVVVFDMG